MKIWRKGLLTFKDEIPLPMETDQSPGGGDSERWGHNQLMEELERLRRYVICEVGLQYWIYTL